MRILYYSDVHIEARVGAPPVPWTELYPLNLGPDLSAFAGTVDLVVLAGDIGPLRLRGAVSTAAYAEQVGAFLQCPVVVVPGNHEYYRGRFEEDRETLLATTASGVTPLDRGELRIPFQGQSLRVLGATLWTDYAAHGDPAGAMRAAAVGLTDHVLIRRRDGGAFTPVDALAEHRLSRKWLAERLAEPHPGPTLVVTHHVPHSIVGNPRYARSELSPAFHSDCDELLAAAAAARAVGWIFGHHHCCQDVVVGGVRLLSAQPGYPGEQTGWSGPGVLEI